MSFSYGDPGARLDHEVRFLTGDTDPHPRKHYLEDEEILYLLKICDNSPGLAAIRGCEAICAKLSRFRDESVGGVSASFSQVFDHYMLTLQTLRTRYVESGAIRPYAGGQSLSEKEAVRSNRDWNAPDFASDMFQGPFGPYSSPGPNGGRRTDAY